MLELVLDAELGKVTFKLLVVAGGSLASSLLLVPFLALCKAVKLVADTAARMVVEVREAIKVGCQDERHAC